MNNYNNNNNNNNNFKIYQQNKEVKSPIRVRYQLFKRIDSIYLLPKRIKPAY